MIVHKGILPPELMEAFPSQSAMSCYQWWVYNNVSLEGVLGVAALLEPDFFESRGVVFRIRQQVEYYECGGSVRNIQAHQAGYNALNLTSFHTPGTEDALDVDELVLAWGRVLVHFWTRALKERFPDRTFQVEMGCDALGEDGWFVTFWEVRPGDEPSSISSFWDTASGTWRERNDDE